ncbi:MAG TPA: DUF4180 domain-containing protein [Myxococcaceae bacterium]
MKLTFCAPERAGDSGFVEGAPGEALLASARDIDRVLEACFAESAGAVLLHAANLPPAFFDLSSGEAGAILQKLRNYRIRLAVVCGPGEVAFSRRFQELLAESQRGQDFRVVETRQAAVSWLSGKS